MRRSALLLSTFLLVTGFGLFAHAQAPSTMQDWHVTPVIPPSNNLKPYCAMANQFDNGFIVTHSRNNFGLGSMAFDFPNTTFEKGKDYKVTLTVDTLSRRYAGIAAKENILIIKTGRDENLFDSIGSGAPMTVTLDGDSKYNLSGNVKAFFEFEHCLQGLEVPLPPKSKIQTSKVETKPSPAITETSESKILKKETVLPKDKILTAPQVKKVEIVNPKIIKPAPKPVIKKIIGQNLKPKPLITPPSIEAPREKIANVSGNKEKDIIPLSKPINPAQITLEKTSHHRTIGGSKSNLLFDNLDTKALAVPSTISDNNIIKNIASQKITSPKINKTPLKPASKNEILPTSKLNTLKKIDKSTTTEFENFRRDFLPQNVDTIETVSLESVLMAAKITHSSLVLEDPTNNIMRWNTDNGDIEGVIVETPWSSETSLLDVLMDDVDLIEQTCQGDFTSQVGVPEKFGDQMIANVETRCATQNSSVIAAHIYQGVGSTIKVWTQSGASDKRSSIMQNRNRIVSVLQQRAKANIVN